MDGENEAQRDRDFPSHERRAQLGSWACRDILSSIPPYLLVAVVSKPLREAGVRGLGVRPAGGPGAVGGDEESQR